MCCFLQAEVGLRYGHVTGVQTCALPIYCSAIRISTGVSRVSSGDAPNITRALRLSSHQNSDRVSARPRERRASERSSLIVRRTAGSTPTPSYPIPTRGAIISVSGSVPPGTIPFPGLGPGGGGGVHPEKAARERWGPISPTTTIELDSGLNQRCHDHSSPSRSGTWPDPLGPVRNLEVGKSLAKSWRRTARSALSTPPSASF